MFHPANIKKSPSILATGIAPSYKPHLDAVRGIAIWLVILYHYLGNYTLTSIGWVGVDLFFVLSGYLITGRLMASHSSPTYFSHFYRNRILRIFPLYYGSLALFFSAMLLIPGDDAFYTNYYRDHFVSFCLFFQNWTFISTGLPPNGWLNHFWSLAIEEQFYLLWPIFIFVAGKSKYLLQFLIGIVSVVLVCRTAYHFQHPGYPVYFNSFFRFDSLVFGAIIFVIESKGIKVRSHLILSASLLFLIAAVYISSTSFFSSFFSTSGFTLLAVFFGFAIFHLNKTPNLLQSIIMRSSFLRFTGKISFGLYIFHWPIYLLFQTRLQSWLDQKESLQPLSTFIIFLTSVLTTFLLAYLSYVYFESYFLRKKVKAVTI